MVLNNRELASLIWLAVAAAWVLSSRDLRSGIASVLKSLANPLLLLPLLGLLGWIDPVDPDPGLSPQAASPCCKSMFYLGYPITRSRSHL